MGMSMADLMAKQDNKSINLTRGQEVEATIVATIEHEIVLDLGSKSEGILNKKDLSPEQLANLKIGDKLQVLVIRTENESGQAVVGLHRISNRAASSPKWAKFEQLKHSGNTVSGKVLELNKGGLVVESNTIRGFLPSSQILIGDAGNLETLIGKDLELTVIEVDSNQNRLIFAQKPHVSKESLEKLSALKEGDTVKGKVKGVLSFGLVIETEDKLDGLVHISETSWDKVDDLNTLFESGQEVEAKVMSIDKVSGRINLSLKALAKDPFEEKASELEVDDIIKVEVSKIEKNGLSATLPNGLEAVLNAPEGEYKVGDTVTVTIDAIDLAKRKITVSPFITSTKDLIYK